MIDQKTKLKMRRVFRRRRKQVVELSSSTEQSLEKHLIKRLFRLPNVRRFLFGWVGLLVVLGLGLVFQTRALQTKYQTVQPIAGGTYTEGIIGTFTNANPLFSSSTVDSSISELVFSGLLKYDKENKLVGDLAESWSLDPTELNYTVILKPNLTWHDGKPLTSKDVVYTYKQIQNPETKSYLLPSWQNIKIEAKDDRTIVFTLPSSLSSFPNSLTNGLVPEHVLADVPSSQLRSNSFNNVNPVGSGPFKFNTVEVVGSTPDRRQERIALSANDSYHFGKPHVDNFVIRTYADEASLTSAFGERQVNAMVGLVSTPDQFAKNKDKPRQNSDIQEISIPLTSGVYVFFKTTNDVLKDPAVRKALVLTTDKKEVLSKVSYPLSTIDSPLLKTQLGYDKNYSQITNNPAEAAKILDAAGWTLDPKTGMRAKAGVPLKFKLSSLSTSEYSGIAQGLKDQWRKLGVDIQEELQKDEEFQGTLALHNYDALLYGISIGTDPDVFAYWHGTQADPRAPTRLNFSEYNSRPANMALEAGRTRSDTQIRSVKYRPFLEAWRNDAPALALYQPRFLYVVRGPLYGLNNSSLHGAADRFSNVEQWKVREGLQ